MQDTDSIRTKTPYKVFFYVVVFVGSSLLLRPTGMNALALLLGIDHYFSGQFQWASVAPRKNLFSTNIVVTLVSIIVCQWLVLWDPIFLAVLSDSWTVMNTLAAGCWSQLERSNTEELLYLSISEYFYCKHIETLLSETSAQNSNILVWVLRTEISAVQKNIYSNMWCDKK